MLGGMKERCICMLVRVACSKFCALAVDGVVFGFEGALRLYLAA